MSSEARHLYGFGPFLLEESEHRLLRDGQLVPLAPKVFETLLMLVQRSGRVVGKDEMMKTIWPDSFVEEANLTQYVFALRKALGEDNNGNVYIETVPKHGYRFVADVNELKEEPAGLVLEKHTSLRIFAEEVQTTGIRTTGPQVPIAIPSIPPETRRRSGRIILTVATLAVLTSLSIAVYWFAVSNQSNASTARTSPKSIAVLPFKNLGAETGDEYLGLGMADALIGRLSSLRQIAVRPTSAVRGFVGQEHDAVTVGRKLGVESVLEGSIQRSGDRIRVSMQLVSLTDGSSIWSENFDGPFTEFFAMQDSISQKVVKALALELKPEQEKLLRKRYTENAEAYQLYLKARYLVDRRGSAVAYTQAKEYYLEAIQLDPNFALAYAGQAEYHILGPPVQHGYARIAAMKALEIDESLAEAHGSLGLIKGYEWDWAGADEEFRRAVELDPNYAMANLWYAGALASTGSVDEAGEYYQRALELDPLSIVINTTIGVRYFHLRQYDKAIAQYRRTLEIDANNLWAKLRLAQVLGVNGQHDEALALYQEAVDFLGPAHGPNNQAILRLGQFYAFTGQRSKAMNILERAKPEENPNYDTALIYIGLGQNDRAFRMLEKVYESRNPLLFGLRDDPRLDAFRTDPRYAELIRRTGLEP